MSSFFSLHFYHPKKLMQPLINWGNMDAIFTLLSGCSGFTLTCIITSCSCPLFYRICVLFFLFLLCFIHNPHFCDIFHFYRTALFSSLSLSCSVSASSIMCRALENADEKPLSQPTSFCSVSPKCSVFLLFSIVIVSTLLDVQEDYH